MSVFRFVVLLYSRNALFASGRNGGGKCFASIWGDRDGVGGDGFSASVPVAIPVSVSEGGGELGEAD